MSQISKDKVARGFSGPIFATTVVLSLSVLLLAFCLVAPKSVWMTQVSASWPKFVTAFLVISLVNCFVEYFFHRYVLHKEAVPFLEGLYQAHHCVHHPLTNITRKRTTTGKEILFLVDNQYPITEEKQKDASIFPWYSLLVFGLLAAPLFTLLQWLLPSFPWFFSGYGALAFSLTLYETFHSIEHWSFERWAPLIEHPRWGGLWTGVYGFHLRHHAVTDCNETISGFFLLPVADWFFGTYMSTKTLYVTGEEWRSENFTKPEPRWPIRWCDKWAIQSEKSRRAKLFAKVKRAKAPEVN